MPSDASPSPIVDTPLSSQWFAWRGHSTAEIERHEPFAALGETDGASTRVSRIMKRQTNDSTSELCPTQLELRATQG